MIVIQCLYVNMLALGEYLRNMLFTNMRRISCVRHRVYCLLSNDILVHT